MKNKMFFLCFAALLFSVTVNSQSASIPRTWNSQFNLPAVQVPKKIFNVSVSLTNLSLLSLMIRFTNVDDGMGYDFYPFDFPLTSQTVTIGSIPAGTYNVEIGDYGPSPIIKNGKTDCDLDYNVHGEPLFWWNLDIGQCSSFTVVKSGL